MLQKSPNTLKFNYMAIANFFVTPKEVATAAGSSILGGAAYGGAYVGSKQLLGEDIEDEAAKREIAANVAAGTVSGMGGYLLSKALQKRQGLM